MIDFSKYPYAAAEIYETVNGEGFEKIIVKPVALFNNENDAIQYAKTEREIEKKVIFNRKDDLLDCCKLNSIRAIKIYGVD